LEKGWGTFSDAQFNEVLRSAYGRVGDELTQNSDLVQKIAETLRLEYKKPSTEPPRF
jgi:hypothetical protein